MMDRTSKRWLLAVIVVSLMVNIYLVRQVNCLEADLRRLSYASARDADVLHSLLTRMNSKLEAMALATEWYSRPEFQVLAVPGEPGQGLVKLSWSFRDLPHDAKVGLSYRLASGDWQEAEVTRVGEALYEAELLVATGLRHPVWGIAYSSDTAPGSKSPSVVAESSHSSAVLLDYIIHSTEDGRQKSGRTESIDLSKLGTPHFQVNIAQGTGGQHYQVHVGLTVPFGGSVRVARIEAVALAADSQQLSSLVLEQEPDGRPAWHGALYITSGKETVVRRIGIRVTYANGETAERQIEVW